MAKYKLIENGVQDTEDNLFIPNDPDNRHWKMYQDWLTQGSPLNVPDPIDILPLDDIKTHANNEIDNTAEGARLRYITAGAGQAMAYQEKSEEAADYVAASYPVDLSSYPFIQAEMNATGKTKEAAANDILTQKSAWIAVGASIEEERLKGKKNVNDASDEAGVNSVKDAAIVLLEAI